MIFERRAIDADTNFTTRDGEPERFPKREVEAPVPRLVGDLPASG